MTEQQSEKAVTTAHADIWSFYRHHNFEDEELCRITDGRHGGPVDEYRCTVCSAREYR